MLPGRSAEEAFGYGENTFMIYTGAPQNTRRKPIDEMNIPAGSSIYQRPWNVPHRRTCAIHH